MYNLDNLDKMNAGAEIAPAVQKIVDFRVKPSLAGDYYKVNCLSNSFMQKFANEGQRSYGTEASKQKAFAFGSAFHEFVLEDKTELFNTISQEEINLLHAMNNQLATCQDETVRYFMDTDGIPETNHYRQMNGLWCKARVDKMVVSDRVFGMRKEGKVLLELKSTSATTQNAFKTASNAFGYNRASSYYMDVTGSDLHITVGISKKRSKDGHRIFTKIVERGSDLYYKGLSEYLGIQADIISNYYE